MKLSTGLSLILATGFIFFGVQKFGAENIVFETIAERSGFTFFEPYVRVLTGVAELLTAIFLLAPRTRLTGAVMGTGVLIGAIGFHLSPWLGIHVPEVGHFLFIAACAMLALAIVTAISLRKSGAKMILIER